jgi:hypothetical protein
LVRLILAAAALVLSACFASAAPIVPGMTVGAFFVTLERAAAELAEGGMEIHRVRCSDDGAMCAAQYGAGNTVIGKAPSKTAGMETVTVTQDIPGETEDFWLTSALVVELIDPDFLTVPERSQLILGAMRGAPGAGFSGHIGRYTFDRLDGLSRMTATAK